MLVTGAVGTIIAAYAAAHMLEVKRLDEQITLFNNHYESVFPDQYPKNVQVVIDATTKNIILDPCEHVQPELMGLGEQLDQIRPMSEKVEGLLKDFQLLEKYGVIIPRDLKIKKGILLHAKAELNAKLAQALEKKSPKLMGPVSLK